MGVSSTFTIGNNFNFNNSTVALGSPDYTTFVGTINLTGSNNFDVTNGAMFAGVVTGTGSLNYTTGSTLLLTNQANTYSGGTAVGDTGTTGGTTSQLQIEASDIPQDAVQTIAFTGAPTGGTFTLAFNYSTTNGTLSATTAPIAYSSTATALQSNIQSALNALSLIGTGNTLVSAASAASVTVTFQGDMTGAPESTLIPAASLLGGTSPSMTVTSTTTGKVVSGPIGTGPLTFAFVYLENQTIPIITGANNSGGNTAELYSTPVITLHNQVNLINSGFRQGGAQEYRRRPVQPCRADEYGRNRQRHDCRR